VDSDPLLRKCEELLVFLHANHEHAKLRTLIVDIEALRDRLLLERGTQDRRTPEEMGQTGCGPVERSDHT
jgi:hypothetical protein